MRRIFILTNNKRWEKIKALKHYKWFDIYREYIFNLLPVSVISTIIRPMDIKDQYFGYSW